MVMCIATDMDGTLLNQHQEITEENRLALLNAIEKGVHVVVATGRSYVEAKNVLQEAGLEVPLICVNGAEIREPDGTILEMNGMGVEESMRAASILREEDIYFEVYTSHGTYTENEKRGVQVLVDIFLTANPEVPKEEVEKKALERFKESDIKEVEGYDALFNNDEVTIYKFLAFSRKDQSLDSANLALRDIPNLAISSSGSDNIEVNSVNAQKGIALKKYVEKHDLLLKDTMAIGDNFNDLSMMKAVGIPVAMGNAAGPIKQYCAYQTLSNRESGVGHIVNKFLEEKED